MIELDKFKIIVENTPLISIDFIIENSEGKYLLGKRVNNPAKGYWFTLGGRIFKNETIKDSIARLSKKEFNLDVSDKDLKFKGNYEHFYEDSFVDDSISTHYIVLLYQLKLKNNLILPMNEHSEYNYFSKDEIMKSNDVHKYVKKYFKGD